MQTEIIINLVTDTVIATHGVFGGPAKDHKCLKGIDTLSEQIYHNMTECACQLKNTELALTCILPIECP